jgi:hypothetical protein
MPEINPSKEQVSFSSIAGKPTIRCLFGWWMRRDWTVAPPRIDCISEITNHKAGGSGQRGRVGVSSFSRSTNRYGTTRRVVRRVEQ